MKEILEELWYGNINPNECGLCNKPELKEVAKYVSRHRDAIEETMSDEQKELLSKLVETMYEYQRLYELEIFKYAFKLGARFTAESLCTDNRSENE